MSNRKVITKPTCHQIAEDAIFELSVARTVLEQMHALFEAIKPHLAKHSGAMPLVELGAFTTQSTASNADVAEERLESSLKDTGLIRPTIKV